MKKLLVLFITLWGTFYAHAQEIQALSERIKTAEIVIEGKVLGKDASGGRGAK